MIRQNDFTDLIQKNEGILIKISGLYSDNYDDAKDLRQEMILQLWKSYTSFKGNSKISTWLYKVCLNTALVFIRKNKQILINLENDQQIFELSEAQNPEFSNQILHLYRAIKKLNKIDRGIILLHLEGNSYQEISEIIGLQASTVGTRLGRIKNKLNQILQGK
jgi:RNA polymerase sigma-70 factor (ECF subfamily)